MSQERDNEQNKEDVEDDFGNACRCHGDAAKTQDSSEQRNHEESESPSKHHDLQRI
jgi:hypothetical protein